MPRSRTDTVLFLAWVLPSFIQGVSGFGTPIALCAPLLVAVGVAGIRAVALTLIGYHWAVGFGSVGSSFYMGALTARLDQTQTAAFANSAAIVLGVNAILAGLLVALMHAGWCGLRESWPLLITVGPAMAVVQWLVVGYAPAIGALCAGAAGIVLFLAVQLLRFKTATSARTDPPGAARSHGLRALTAATPHLALAVLALAVLAPPPVRAFVHSHLLIGPSFPATSTERGVVNDAVTTYNPIALLGHPGVFLLAGCAVGLVVWRASGAWRPGTWAEVRKPWLAQALKASPSVVLLAAIAGVLVDTGMIRAVALGTAAVAGPAYPALAPLIGALGSFITGSTTSSNALFSALQRDVATLTAVPPEDLLAAQLAGGNIGNSLTPMVALLGTSAIGRPGTEGQAVRRTLPAAAALLVSAIAVTFVLLAIHS
ncbi:MAG: L-lactate permease [Micromonosporaceae bacterium]